VHVVVDTSYEFVDQNCSEDQNSSDISCKNIIVGKGDQKFFHDTYFHTHLSFDHYQDSNVEEQEHTFSFLSKTVSCDRPAYHHDGFKLQRYGDGEQKGSDQQLSLYFPLTEKKQFTFNIDISEGSQYH
jgi:hypothetical protein